MRIAVCDDDVSMSGIIERLVDECYRGERAYYQCEVFLSAKDLLKGITDMGRFHIYILDIEMEETNGLQLAARIRENDSNAIIIFITSHKELMQAAFDVQAFQYIVKPFEEEKVKGKILKALEFQQMKNNFFQFKIGKQTLVEDYDNILYFENQRRKVIIHTLDKKYEYYGTLSDVEKSVSSLLFVRIHTSFVINMEYLKTVEQDMAVMKSGLRLPASRSHLHELNLAYQNFILMRLG